MEYNGKKYHTGCFACMKCRKPIGDNTFMPMEGKFMCMNCYNDNCAAKCGGCSKVGDRFHITVHLLCILAVCVSDVLSLTAYLDIIFL